VVPDVLEAYDLKNTVLVAISYGSRLVRVEESPYNTEQTGLVAFKEITPQKSERGNYELRP
jgi:hypothetical protein